MQTILAVNFAVSRNADIFIHEKLTKLLPRTLKCTFTKENFVRKEMKNLRKEFLQLFIETLPNKLTLLPKKKNNSPT